MRDRKEVVEYILKKLEKGSGSFILSSYCSDSLLETVKDFSAQILTKLSKNERSKLNYKNVKKRIEENEFPDFILIKPEGKNIAVEHIRENILNVLNHSPMESKKRIIVIKDAHWLNKTSANILLKSIEEPPADTSFILLTTNLNRIIPTIRSRSEIILMPILDKKDFIDLYQPQDNNSFDLLLELSSKNKSRLDFYLENIELINELIDFVNTVKKPVSFVKIKKLSEKISAVCGQDINKIEYFAYAIIKLLTKNNYNLAKKVLDIFDGIYFNTKDTLVYENMFLEICS